MVLGFFCINYTCSVFLRCIFELCFANINGTVLLIVVALSHVHPMPCPPAAPRGLCSTLDITLYCITAVKYEKKITQSLHGLYPPRTNSHLGCTINLDKLSVFEVHSLSLHCYFHCCVFDLTKSSELVKASVDTVPLAHVGL